MVIILIIAFILIIAALGIATESVCSSGEKFVIMSLGIVGIAVLLIGLISADILYEDVSIISKHTDHDKIN